MSQRIDLSAREFPTAYEEINSLPGSIEKISYDQLNTLPSALVTRVVRRFLKDGWKLEHKDTQCLTELFNIKAPELFLVQRLLFDRKRRTIQVKTLAYSCISDPTYYRLEILNISGITPEDLEYLISNRRRAKEIVVQSTVFEDKVWKMLSRLGYDVSALKNKIYLGSNILIENTLRIDLVNRKVSVHQSYENFYLVDAIRKDSINEARYLEDQDTILIAQPMTDVETLSRLLRTRVSTVKFRSLMDSNLETVLKNARYRPVVSAHKTDLQRLSDLGFQLDLGTSRIGNTLILLTKNTEFVIDLANRKITVENPPQPGKEDNYEVITMRGDDTPIKTKDGRTLTVRKRDLIENVFFSVSRVYYV